MPPLSCPPRAPFSCLTRCSLTLSPCPPGTALLHAAVGALRAGSALLSFYWALSMHQSSRGLTNEALLEPLSSEHLPEAPLSPSNSGD